MPHPSRRPWIVAHQGAPSGEVLPNTIEAFGRAFAVGADAVELDLRRTADGAVVVHHDAVLPGGGRPILVVTRVELAASAPHVPDLEEVLAALPDRRLHLEVKNAPFDPDWDPDETTVRALVARVDAAGARDRVTVLSFNEPTVAVAREAGLHTGWLLWHALDPLEILARWGERGHAMVLPRLSAMEGEQAAAVVSAAREAGAEVGVWTVNEAEEMRRLADLGVTTIYTDEVEVARATLG